MTDLYWYYFKCHTNTSLVPGEYSHIPALDCADYKILDNQLQTLKRLICIVKLTKVFLQFPTHANDKKSNEENTERNIKEWVINNYTLVVNY